MQRQVGMARGFVARLIRACCSMLAMVFLTGLTVQAARALELDQLSDKLSVTGSVRSRVEMWNWFDSHAPGNNNDRYYFVGERARLGFQWTDDDFEIGVEGQATGLINMPTDAVASGQGPLGLGGAYYAHNRARDDAGVFLKQAYLILKSTGIDGLTLKGGRFEFSEGREVLSGDATLDWLKRFRIAERLIGPFGWSHVGRAFDGAVASYGRDALNATLMYSHPTQGGFDLAANREMNEIDLVYAALNLTRPDFAADTDARIFYIYYGDTRDLNKVDNRPAAVRLADRQDIALHTFGGHWLHRCDTDYGVIDLMAWGVMQRGDWGQLSQESNAFDLEIGWQPEGLPWRPWLRAGYGRTSGDDDPSDDTHGTFFQILPTARIYSLSTFYNLMNNEDAFLQIILRPRKGVVWRTDFHSLRVSESKDLWYQGAGATLADRAPGFGYLGRATGGSRDLMRVLETQLVWELTGNVSTTLYYGHEFGSSIVRQTFQGDSGDFGYVELTFKL